MAKYCADCKNLNEKKKKNGASGGCLYECKKTKKYINSTMLACDNFAKDYNRNWYKAQCIYDDEKNLITFQSLAVMLSLQYF